MGAKPFSDAFSLVGRLGKSRPVRLPRAVLGLCLLLLFLLLSFAPTGNTAYAQVSCTDGPAVCGQWSAPFDTCSVGTCIVGIHAAVLHTGKVLLIEGYEKSERLGKVGILTPPAIGESGSGSFDFVNKPPPGRDNTFCSGHTLLPDGRLLIFGGHKKNQVGIKDTNIFNPDTEMWTEGTPMAYARWYPTGTTLPNGRVLAVSGNSSPGRLAAIPEVYNPTPTPAGLWEQLTSTSVKRNLPLYPWMFVLPSGKVFNAGPNEDTATLDVINQIWTTVDDTNDGDRLEYDAPAVMYEPGKILIIGGKDPAIKTAEIIDMNQNNPQWQHTDAMKHNRRHHNATLLPDGKVLATGGTASGNDKAQAVYAAELFDPATGTWTEMASMQRPRVYHSTAFLLPDGRVVVTGTDNDTTFEIYSPPYLFKGYRSEIPPALPSITYSSSFEVNYSYSAPPPEGTTIKKVALIRPSSVTHSFNMDQRYVPLTVTNNPPGGPLTITAPANSNEAPPGYYMLFIVDSNGVPSKAAWVQVKS